MGSSLALILVHSFVSAVWEARPGPISTSYCSADLKILAPYRQLETTANPGLHTAGYSILRPIPKRHLGYRWLDCHSDPIQAVCTERISGKGCSEMYPLLFRVCGEMGAPLMGWVSSKCVGLYQCCFCRDFPSLRKEGSICFCGSSLTKRSFIEFGILSSSPQCYMKFCRNTSFHAMLRLLYA